MREVSGPSGQGKLQRKFGAVANRIGAGDGKVLRGRYLGLTVRVPDARYGRIVLLCWDELRRPCAWSQAVSSRADE